jgi:hypothetical protein
MQPTKQLSVPLDKRLSSHPLPVKPRHVRRLLHYRPAKAHRYRPLKRIEHLLAVGKPLVRIDRQRLPHESNHRTAGPLHQPLLTAKRPTERPPRQNTRNILVKNQPDRKAVAAIRRPPVSLLRRNITRRPVIVDRLHPPLDLQRYPEITKRRPFFSEQKYITRRHITVHKPILMSISKPIKNLDHN